MSFVEEGKKKAELVRKALVEGRVYWFKWAKDGSDCNFYYRGIDHHGLPCTFSSSLNKENSIAVFAGLKLEFSRETSSTAPRLTQVEKTTRLCEFVSELKAMEEQNVALREQIEQMIVDEQEDGNDG